MTTKTTRRRFLATLPAILAGVASLRVEGLVAAVPASTPAHPDPRPGIDGSTVLTADDLVHAPHVIELYDQVRQIPHIVDGIRCHCGCADLPRTRSLLSCYEKGGIAAFCEICQGQGSLAFRRWKEGQGLERIRRAIDARYGPGSEEGDRLRARMRMREMASMAGAARP